MKLIKVAASAINQTPFDWRQNQKNILAAIQSAKAQEVSILCLPELCITGYGCEDMFHSPSLQQRALHALLDIVPQTRGVIVSLGLPLLHRNGLFNTAALVADGQIIGFVAKRFLAGEGLHYEPRWFKAWPQDVTSSIEIDGVDYPLGDIFFDLGGIKIGFEICEDAWVAARPGSDLSLKGADIILNPSASHFAFGKLDVRKRFVLEGSRAFGVSYIYSNLLGNEAGRAIYDGGALIASSGQLLATGPRFSFQDCLLTTAVIDVDKTRMNQARTGSFEPDLEDSGANCVKAEFHFPTIEPALSQRQEQPWEASSHKQEEEFTRAVALGLFDYLRKSKSKGFAISLSGGADSSATACLVGLMVELGTRELGTEGFLSKLPQLNITQTAASSKEIVHNLLTCVYQATANSSDTTRSAACTIANAVGADYLEFDVETMSKAYTEMVSAAIGRPLTWASDDVSLQNIQARVRAPGIWLLANLRSELLLSTSNRSEAAVGYATMDGDTCGGLSPIAGIDKAFLKQWLNWLEKQGPEGLHPIPELSVVNCQAPTAELRPTKDAQTDEKDLMPYPVLDFIEAAAIRDKQSPIEIFRLLQLNFAQYSNEELGLWVERFFRLWCQNQWKRERYAPSFHLDDLNLDPKTWCRFPILSGGFEQELEDLRSYVAKQGKVLKGAKG